VSRSRSYIARWSAFIWLSWPESCSTCVESARTVPCRRSFSACTLCVCRVRAFARRGGVCVCGSSPAVLTTVGSSGSSGVGTGCGRTRVVERREVRLRCCDCTSGMNAKAATSSASAARAKLFFITFLLENCRASVPMPAAGRRFTRARPRAVPLPRPRAHAD
jgi:hypothetical protein